MLPLKIEFSIVPVFPISPLYNSRRRTLREIIDAPRFFYPFDLDPRITGWSFVGLYLFFFAKANIDFARFPNRMSCPAVNEYIQGTSSKQTGIFGVRSINPLLDDL